MSTTPRLSLRTLRGAAAPIVSRPSRALYRCSCPLSPHTTSTGTKLPLAPTTTITNGRTSRCLTTSITQQRPTYHRRPYHTTSSPKHSASTSSSVDPSEISHFTTLASSWWDPHGPSRLLHLMNPLRHDFLGRCLASSSSAGSGGANTSSYTSSSDGPAVGKEEGRGKTYLDIGCGGGIFAESAARLLDTKHVTGLDPTAAVLDVARAHALQDPRLKGKLEYVLGDVETFSPPSSPLSDSTDSSSSSSSSSSGDSNGNYDVITVFEVLEHVPVPSSFLDAALPLLKPGGWLVGSTISRTWTSWFTTKLVAEDLLRIVPRGTHEWDKYVNAGELGGYLRHSAAAATGGGWDPESLMVMGVMYVPGLGWKEVSGGEDVGNYFFGFRRAGYVVHEGHEPNIVSRTSRQ